MRIANATTRNICKLRKAILSVFYNILPPNPAILLILGRLCSLCLDQMFVYNAFFSIMFHEEFSIWDRKTDFFLTTSGSTFPRIILHSPSLSMFNCSYFIF